ncbi:hypothetical protein ACFLXT_02000 [Chloroflexota bacterium]
MQERFKIFEDIKNVVQKNIELWVDQMTPIAAAYVKADSEALRKRIVVKGSNVSSRFNGRVRSLDNWATFQVEINTGLTLLAHRIADLFVSYLGYMNSEGEPTEGGVVSKTVFLKELKGLLNAYWGDGAYHPFQYELDGRREYNDEHFAYAAILAEGMHRFVIGHELGHVVVKVGNRPLYVDDVYVNLMRVDKSKIPVEDQELIDQTTREWAEELSCDWMGIKLTDAYFESIERVGMTQVFNAAELFFLILMILEKTGEKKFGNLISLGSHPPSAQRLSLLRLSTSQMPAHVHKMGKAFENLVLDIIRKL